jgi:AhpD family alkylhydroperoxidase
MDFLAMIRRAGFRDAEIVGETGFNSSPATRGTLFRAKKTEGGCSMSIKDGLEKYREFFDVAYADGAMDRKTKNLIALGASLGAGCEHLINHHLAVARDMGASEEELTETMAIAMTIGASKIQSLQQRAMDSLPKKQTEPISNLKPLTTLEGPPPGSPFT